MAKTPARSTTRGSSTPSRGGRPAGRQGVYVATPQSDIYVTLLAVSLGAMLISITLLALRLNDYGFKVTPG